MNSENASAAAEKEIDRARRKTVECQGRDAGFGGSPYTVITRLAAGGWPSPEEWRVLFSQSNHEAVREALFCEARRVREQHFGKKVYIRGLIEFTNYCGNDCFYCGIRRSNHEASRYRLTEEQILDCCAKGHGLGFRTFVLQGGEDAFYTDERMVQLIAAIKSRYPDCALTLSIGERPRVSYEAFYKAGADRYLLRHETADPDHYRYLHPKEQTLENRLECLNVLKEIGFQTGAGFMVGSPGQTVDCIIRDMAFLRRFQPHMVGLGPFIPHKETPFRGKKAGDLGMTLFLLGIVRLILPRVLLPATTALGTIDPMGREKGILAGANVVMPNLSPLDVREKYMLYDNKISTGDEAAESLSHLKTSMAAIGYKIPVDRGDAPL